MLHQLEKVDDFLSFLSPTDDEEPTLVCPDDISRDTDADQAYATVTYAPKELSDNDVEDPTLTGSPSGNQFSIGTTEVTLTAADASGNEKSCSFGIAVTGKLSGTLSNCLNL